MASTQATDDHRPLDLSDIILCEGCQKLKKEVDHLQEEHALKFKTLKQKIISTDLLIRKYRTKSEEYDAQNMKVEELSRKLDKVQRDSDTLEAQLKSAMLEIEPLKREKSELEVQKRIKDEEILVFKDKLKGAENMRHQYEALDRTREGSIGKFEEEKKLNARKIQALENSNKKQDTQITKLREECRTLKLEKAVSMKRYKTVEMKLIKTLKKLEKFWMILKENGLRPQGERKPKTSFSFNSSMSESSVTEDSLVDEIVKNAGSEVFDTKQTDEEDDEANCSELDFPLNFSPMIPMLSPLPPTPVLPQVGDENKSIDLSSDNSVDSDVESVTDMAFILESDLLQSTPKKVLGKTEKMKTFSHLLSETKVSEELSLIQQDENSNLENKRREKENSLQDTKKNYLGLGKNSDHLGTEGSDQAESANNWDDEVCTGFKPDEDIKEVFESVPLIKKTDDISSEHQVKITQHQETNITKQCAVQNDLMQSLSLFDSKESVIDNHKGSVFDEKENVWHNNNTSHSNLKVLQEEGKKNMKTQSFCDRENDSSFTGKSTLSKSMNQPEDKSSSDLDKKCLLSDSKSEMGSVESLRIQHVPQPPRVPATSSERNTSLRLENFKCKKEICESSSDTKVVKFIGPLEKQHPHVPNLNSPLQGNTSGKVSESKSHSQSDSDVSVTTRHLTQSFSQYISENSVKSLCKNQNRLPVTGKEKVDMNIKDTDLQTKCTETNTEVEVSNQDIRPETDSVKREYPHVLSEKQEEKDQPVCSSPFSSEDKIPVGKTCVNKTCVDRTCVDRTCTDKFKRITRSSGHSIEEVHQSDLQEQGGSSLKQGKSPNKKYAAEAALPDKQNLSVPLPKVEEVSSGGSFICSKQDFEENSKEQNSERQTAVVQELQSGETDVDRRQGVDCGKGTVVTGDDEKHTFELSSENVPNTYNTEKKSLVPSRKSETVSENKASKKELSDCEGEEIILDLLRESPVDYGDGSDEPLLKQKIVNPEDGSVSEAKKSEKSQSKKNVNALKIKVLSQTSSKSKVFLKHQAAFDMNKKNEISDGDHVVSEDVHGRKLQIDEHPAGNSGTEEFLQQSAITDKQGKRGVQSQKSFGFVFDRESGSSSNIGTVSTAETDLKEPSEICSVEENLLLDQLREMPRETQPSSSTQKSILDLICAESLASSSVSPVASALKGFMDIVDPISPLPPSPTAGDRSLSPEAGDMSPLPSPSALGASSPKEMQPAFSLEDKHVPAHKFNKPVDCRKLNSKRKGMVSGIVKETEVLALETPLTSVPVFSCKTRVSRVSSSDAASHTLPKFGSDAPRDVITVKPKLRRSSDNNQTQKLVTATEMTGKTGSGFTDRKFPFRRTSDMAYTATSVGSRKRKHLEPECLPPEKRQITVPKVEPLSTPDISEQDKTAVLEKKLCKWLSANSITEDDFITELLHGSTPSLLWPALLQALVQTLKNSDADFTPAIIAATDSNDLQDVFLMDNEMKLFHLLARFRTKYPVVSWVPFMESLWIAIFSQRSVSKLGKMALCRMYTALCRFEGDVEQVRVFLFHILSCVYLNQPQLVLSVAGVWPLALHKSQSDPYPMVLVIEHCIIKCLQCTVSRTKQLEEDISFIKTVQIFKSLCGWSDTLIPSVQILHVTLNMMQNLILLEGEGDLFHMMKSVELLCFKEGWEWTYKYFVNKYLMSVTDRWTNSPDGGATTPQYLMSMLRIFGGIFQLPIQHTHKDFCSALKRCLFRVLDKPTEVSEVPLCCVEVLLELSPFAPVLIMEDLLGWYRGNRKTLSEEYRKKLQDTRQQLMSKIKYFRLDPFE